MARLNTLQPSSRRRIDSSQSSFARHPPRTASPPSSAQSFGSEKENRDPTRPSKGKRPSTSTSMADQGDADSGSARKRRKVSGTNPLSQNAHQKELERLDTRYYDPDQDPEERREVVKNLRSLTSKYFDSKTEYLKAANNKGLEETLREADKLYKNVKHTADATIDSRLLVDVADSSFKKINDLALGNKTSGIDVDDFVSRCIWFMKRGDEAGQVNGHNPPSNTQTQRQRLRVAADDDQDEDEDQDQGDTMNWSYLGRNACFLYNSRPCLTGFLLGPLSVQKKTRQQTQRKAREARSQTTRVMGLTELGEEELDQQESASLTVVCTEIARLLSNAQDKGMSNAEIDFQQLGEDSTEEEAAEVLRRHGMADNGCLPMFNFCVNPKSFGQTVENLFYVSFLIKEGKVGLDFDSNGLPTLGIAAVRSVAERQETKRNQAVFTLDFDVWQEIIKSFGIQKCIIPHRKEEKYDDGIIDYARMEDDDAREVEHESDDSS